MLSEAQFQQAPTVAEDLSFLMNEWQPRLEQSELRRLSPVLRRLLVQGEYGRAWRNLGLQGEPYVAATGLSEMLGIIDRTAVMLAFAPPGETVRKVLQSGGQLQVVTPEDIAPGSVIVLVPGVDLGFGPILAVVPPEKLSRIAADPQREASDAIGQALGRRVVRGMGLTAFLRSPAALVAGIEVSREDVIKYVANKVGGAHFDDKRAPRDESFSLLDRTLMKYAPEGQPEAVFTYAELLSIAEFLAESSDAARFMAAFNKAEREAAEGGSET
jgi:hypothetical protein